MSKRRRVLPVTRVKWFFLHRQIDARSRDWQLANRMLWMAVGRRDQRANERAALPPSASCTQRRIAALGNVMSMESKSMHHPYSEGQITRVSPKYRIGKIFHSLCAAKWLYTHNTPMNPYRPNTPVPLTPRVPKQIPLQSQMRIESG